MLLSRRNLGSRRLERPDSRHVHHCVHRAKECTPHGSLGECKQKLSFNGFGLILLDKTGPFFHQPSACTSARHHAAIGKVAVVFCNSDARDPFCAVLMRCKCRTWSLEGRHVADAVKPRPNCNFLIAHYLADQGVRCAAPHDEPDTHWLASCHAGPLCRQSFRGSPAHLYATSTPWRAIRR